jgi:hypothetical protein
VTCINPRTSWQRLRELIDLVASPLIVLRDGGGSRQGGAVTRCDLWRPAEAAGADPKGGRPAQGHRRTSDVAPGRVSDQAGHVAYQRDHHVAGVLKMPRPADQPGRGRRTDPPSRANPTFACRGRLGWPIPAPARSVPLRESPQRTFFKYVGLFREGGKDTPHCKVGSCAHYFFS